MATIRLATTADARGSAEVRVRGWQVGYEGIVDAVFLAAMSVDQNEERWREIIDARGERIRVATVGTCRRPARGACGSSFLATARART